MESHGACLHQITGDPQLVESLKEDPETTSLPDQERTLVDFVIKLNRTPSQIEESDLERLRKHGFDDRAILDIVLLAGLYEVMNRLADGLGVKP